MENALIYQQGSDTIRQMPQNYLVAYRRHDGWICDPDLAADRTLCNKVFNALFDHSTKYGTPENLLSKVIH